MALILVSSMAPLAIGAALVYFSIIPPYLQSHNNTLVIPLEQMGYIALTFCVSIFLLSAAFSYLSGKKLSGPIRELQRGAILLKNGNWNHKFNLKNEGEIGLLGDSFNKILTDLKDQNDALRNVNKELHKQSVVDPLTGLLNRRGLQIELTREMARVQRYNKPVHAVLIDIDDFKEVNESVGYVIGDQVLCEIANKISENLRKDQLVARIGGDEFLIILPAVDARDAEAVTERLRQAIAGSSIFVGSKTIEIRASLGLCALPRQIVCVDEALALTHKALLQSKRSGKNQYSFLNQDASFSERGETKERMVEALLLPSNYEIFKQPVVRLEDEKVLGYEMLTRFKLEELRNPTHLFQFALENHSLTYVDHLCMKKCIDAIQQINENCKFHVNALPSTLVTLPMDDLVRHICGKINPKHLCIEISEQQIIGDFFALKQQVDILRQAGIGIAIDDVGFGRTCLENIIMLQPNVVKIDKRFVIGCGASRTKQLFISRIVTMLSSLNIYLIAEGIENREDLETLKTLKIHTGQGYLFGRPSSTAVQ